RRPPGDSPQRALGNRDVVIDKIQLRVTGARKEHLVGIRDRDFAARDLEDNRLRLRHTDSVAGWARPAQAAAPIQPGAGAWPLKKRPAARPRAPNLRGVRLSEEHEPRWAERGLGAKPPIDKGRVGGPFLYLKAGITS